MHVTVVKEESSKMSVRATTRNGRKIWLVEVKRDYGRFHRRRFLDRSKYLKTDAKAIEDQILREYKAQKQQGGHLCSNGNAQGAFSDEPLPFSTFADQFLAVQDPQRSDFANKKRNIKIHLEPFFGNTPLPKISRQMIDKFRVRLRTSPIAKRSGRRRKPRTINNILTTLHTILALAFDYDLIEKIPKVKKVPVPQEDPDFLTPEEVLRLLDAVPDQWRPLVRTALLTGLRRGELYELRWFDIKLDGPSPYIRVTRSVKIGNSIPEYRVKTTKSRRGRTVPLNREMVELLTAHKPAGADRYALVFTESDGGYMLPKRLYRVVTQAGEAIGRPVRPHLLRHTFASGGYMEGIPAQVIQQWLGHSDVTTTQRYAHVRPDTGRDLIELLSTKRKCEKSVRKGCEETENTSGNT